MSGWKWTERRFSFDYPVTKFRDLLERVRGTPARIEERVRGLRGDVLCGTDGRGWSIQQNIGHLIDLGYLPLARIDQILQGEATLLAADMDNRQTNDADHNSREIGEVLSAFRKERSRLVERFESIDPREWGKSALHPRIQQPMRIVDIAYFDAEHDDYHLSRVSELIRILG